ncbi:MAG: YkgJ family cysteine cluster protein [Proteobacteria bacterium]|nr:YkgJ family cysteine cluster protein [Pseudomonadota bacterium]MBU1584630.1 YkgJ family cysteine cluster protein [Pseudomonadota bacterium]MBU2627255.1 YkgJ family cysteine cluster protein [Pseudomonadota bacterium]
MSSDAFENHPLTAKDGQKMLESYVKKTTDSVCKLVDDNELSIDILAYAMQQFMSSLLALPKDVVCEQGCAYCCHLRVGVSIPEALVIFNELSLKAPPAFFETIKKRVAELEKSGDTLDDAWWHTTRTACPFLEKQAQSICGIYNLRPMSCRAYHSTLVEACREGYEKGCETKIPCFPLFRSMTNMYSTAFIRAMDEKGLHSYQVGFCASLNILFSDDTAAKRWLKGDDVFLAAKLL